MLIYNECYHGTSYKNFLSIKTEKNFKYTRRHNHWLGQGTYFFIEDIEKAKWFVRVSTTPAIKTAKKCVIKISITIENERFLNLDTELGRKNLNDFAKELKKQGVLVKEKHKISTNAEVRCIFIDSYTRYNKIQAVKYTFTDDKISYQNLNTNDSSYDRIQNSGTQINVVDQSIINFDDLNVQCI